MGSAVIGKAVENRIYKGRPQVEKGIPETGGGVSVGAWGERAGLGGPSALIEGSIKMIIRGQGEGIRRP